MVILSGITLTVCSFRCLYSSEKVVRDVSTWKSDDCWGSVLGLKFSWIACVKNEWGMEAMRMGHAEKDDKVVLAGPFAEV